MSFTEKNIQNNSFIVLGGHKCGTTSLHQYLGQHPEIVMPQFKGEDILKKPNFQLNEYYEQYIDTGNKKIIGEVSSAYLYSEKACQNIKKYFPQCKLVIVLRNPFERAFSHFNDMPNTHPLAQKNINFSNICQNPSNFFEYNILYLGLYYSYIKMFFQEFEREQICILFFDDFVNNKDKYYQTLFKFVGADPNFIPNTSVILRKGGKTGIKNKQINQIFSDKSFIRSLVGNIIKPFTTPEQRRLMFLKTRNLFIQRKPVSVLPDELKQNLINFYQEDILKMQDLLNTDLSHWLH